MNEIVDNKRAIEEKTTLLTGNLYKNINDQKLSEIMDLKDSQLEILENIKSSIAQLNHYKAILKQTKNKLKICNRVLRAEKRKLSKINKNLSIQNRLIVDLNEKFISQDEVYIDVEEYSTKKR